MFLDKITPEQKEIKRAKFREYYHKMKGENKIKHVSEMSEREKRQQRKNGKKPQKSTEKRKNANAVSNSPLPSENLPAVDAYRTSRKQLARKTVKRKG